MISVEVFTWSPRQRYTERWSISGDDERCYVALGRLKLYYQDMRRWQFDVRVLGHADTVVNVTVTRLSSSAWRGAAKSYHSADVVARLRDRCASDLGIIDDQVRGKASWARDGSLVRRELCLINGVL